MSEPNITEGVKVISVARSVLVANEIWLCINQVGRTTTDIAKGKSNVAALALLTSLLKADGAFAPLDQDCDDPALVRVLVFPELTFGIDDWPAINAAVDAYRSPLLLIAGFGITKAKDLRGRAPFIAENVSDNRNVNYGCIWLRIPASGERAACHETHFFCKNFIEQSNEAPAFDSLQHNEILVIQFEDLTVCPLICADLIADSQDKKPNAIDRLKNHSKLFPNIPMIVTGSLLQPEPWHDIWASKMDRVVDAVPAVLALANVADTKLPDCYLKDVRRNLSGVYTAVSNHKDRAHLSLWSSTRHEATLCGQPLRTSSALSVGGPVRVRDYSPSKGRHLWQPKWGKSFVEGKLICTWSHSVQFEMPRLLSRARHFSPSHDEKLSNLELHISTAPADRQVALLTKLLLGPNAASAALEPCETQDLNEATENALCAVDALKRSPAFDWPSDSSVPLKLTLIDSAGEVGAAINTYIWRSPYSNWQAMTQELVGYAQDAKPHPGIVVVAGDKTNTPPDIRDIQQFYDNASPKPEDGTMDFTAPRGSVNRVAVVPFAEAVKLSGSVKNEKDFKKRADQIVNEANKQLLYGATK